MGFKKNLDDELDRRKQKTTLEYGDDFKRILEITNAFVEDHLTPGSKSFE